ncbi:hypothetical protein BEH94_11205 [Candidatus Altiarchaeales archaeon WOR_SM1_SCG]|nr:hypothetical protein BEH94_11205 [Candidatus Altiarchaeales archaeon WOR_SM1_SCG]
MLENLFDFLYSVPHQLDTPWGYVLLFIAIFICTATVVISMPDPLIVFTSGYYANPLLVGLVAGVASAFGELISYFVGRGGAKIGEKAKIEGKKYNKVQEIFNKYGFWSIPVFSFTPLPLDLIGIVAGSLRYNIKKFFIGVLIGKIPKCLILAYAGHYGLMEMAKFFGL